MLKKLIGAVLSLFVLTTGATADYSGFRTQSGTIIGAESAMKSEELALKFSLEAVEGETFGTPAVSGESVYITSGKRLLKISAESGKTQAEFTSEAQFNLDYAPTILGNTIATACGSELSVLDAESLTQRYLFNTDGYTIVTPITLSDEVAFFGGDKDGTGAYFAVKDGLELWRYELDMSVADCGAVVHKGRLIFGGGENAVNHSLETDEFELLSLGGVVSSTPFADEYAVYMTTDNGYVHKFRLNDDGSFEDGTLTSCFVDDARLSSPLVNMGRIYVSAVGKPFTVLDSLNMEIAYRIDGLSSGSAPVATVANGVRVLVFNDKAPYFIYSIYDYEAIEKPQFTPIAQFNEYDGAMKSVVMGSDGVIYVRATPHTLAALAYKGLDYVVITIKLVLVAALFILFVLWLRVLSKKNRDKKSPFLRS